MAVRSNVGERKGIVIVEAAILFPLLLLLTLGIIEYGWMFLKAEDAASAARHGARLASRPDATNAEVQLGIRRLMTAAGLGNSGYAVTIRPGDVGALAPGEPLTVEVAIPYRNIALTGSPLMPVPPDLRASVTMVKEGP